MSFNLPHGIKNYGL